MDDICFFKYKNQFQLINLNSDSFTTLTLFNFGKNWYWPFKQMAFAKNNFSKVKGLEFSKVMGTGSGSGFSLIPDFSTYAILCVWSNTVILFNKINCFNTKS